jgi:hypothetical protein
MRLLILIIALFLSSSAYAQSRYLTQQDIQRVREVKQLLNGIDKESLQQTINDLEKTRYPQINLQIREAMAKTYTDIAQEFNVTGQKKKEWLYSMVCLNMAYLQFGGDQGNSRNSTDLNRLIRQKLNGYLPLKVLKQHGMIYSLD